jgi:hypothetical protein
MAPSTTGDQIERDVAHGTDSDGIVDTTDAFRCAQAENADVSWLDDRTNATTRDW